MVRLFEEELVLTASRQGTWVWLPERWTRSVFLSCCGISNTASILCGLPSPLPPACFSEAVAAVDLTHGARSTLLIELKARDGHLSEHLARLSLARQALRALCHHCTFSEYNQCSTYRLARDSTQ